MLERRKSGEMFDAILNAGTGCAKAEKKNHIHYKGELGEFDYDPEKFELVEGPFVYLHYKGKGLNVNLPDGCISIKCMFYKCSLPEGFTLGG